MIYAQEKLRSAIYVLATDFGDLRNRLVEAYWQLNCLSENDFQNREHQQEWQSIIDAFNTEQATAENGSDENSMEALDEGSLVELTIKFYRLHSNIMK